MTDITEQNKSVGGSLETAKLEYIIEVKTGLHIGGSEDKVGIGGIDNRVITERIYLSNNNFIEVPIIPGSSIKGRIRSLLELKYQNDESKKGLINLVFGRSLGEKESGGQQSQGDMKMATGRAIFRDAFPGDEQDNYNPEVYIDKNKKIFQNREWSEIKGENQINRTTGVANPRFTERVRPGFKFREEIIITRLKSDNVTLEEMKNLIKEGFELLNSSYLGGHGTRGYGKVQCILLDKKN